MPVALQGLGEVLQLRGLGFLVCSHVVEAVAVVEEAAHQKGLTYAPSAIHYHEFGAIGLKSPFQLCTLALAAYKSVHHIGSYLSMAAKIMPF